MNNNSHKTAITRTKPSAPLSYLTSKDLLEGRILDYGCGKGFDADHFQFDKYDPHFFPDLPTKCYHKIICQYVLNTISAKESLQVLNNIQELLIPEGKAYVVVRRDIKTEGVTKKGTYQRNVILNLKVIKETDKFCIYELEKTTCLTTLSPGSKSKDPSPR